MKTTIAEARWDENRRYWKINVQQDGVRKSFYEKTEGRKGKKMCEAKAQEWLDDNCPADMTFAVAWEKYLASKKGHIDDDTWKMYDRIVKSHLFPTLGKKKLSKITVQNWQDALDRFVRNGAKKSTCVYLRSRITNFARYAKKAGMPMADVSMLDIPAEAEEVNRTTLQPDDLTKLFTIDTTVRYDQVVQDFYIHAYRFAAITGLRRGELVGLRWEDIEGGVLSVKRSIKRIGKVTAGKNDNARRCIMLPKRALAELEAQKALLKAEGLVSPWVFPKDNGLCLAPTCLLYRWHVYQQVNGLPDLCLHELRHTAVSMYETDVPMNLLKQAIGHSESMDTHGSYGHKFGNADARTADAMDRVLDAILG